MCITSSYQLIVFDWGAKSREPTCCHTLSNPRAIEDWLRRVIITQRRNTSMCTIKREEDSVDTSHETQPASSAGQSEGRQTVKREQSEADSSLKRLKQDGSSSQEGTRSTELYRTMSEPPRLYVYHIRAPEKGVEWHVMGNGQDFVIGCKASPLAVGPDISWHFRCLKDNPMEKDLRSMLPEEKDGFPPGMRKLAYHWLLDVREACGFADAELLRERRGMRYRALRMSAGENPTFMSPDILAMPFDVIDPVCYQ
jgi:Ni/Co efflux regulator RcnB